MIDAHQHFWRIGQNDCVWPGGDLAAIHRDFEPAELERLARAAGVEGTVLVQSQESDRDTDYLLDLAEATPWVKAVVGWVDLASPKAPARIAALAGRPKFRGVRPMLQGLAEVDWILWPELEPAVAALGAHGLGFDALVQVRHLPALARFARRHPRLAIVIDHAAKPDIAGDGRDEWRAALAPLAALKNVSCKLSGLLTEAAAGQGAEALAPYVVDLLDLFGPTRLMWGSDWPVLNLAGDYAAWLAMARDLVRQSVVGSAGDEALAAIFGGAAQSFYRF
jgi:L-fuconolactonase